MHRLGAEPAWLREAGAAFTPLFLVRGEKVRVYAEIAPQADDQSPDG